MRIVLYPLAIAWFLVVCFLPVEPGKTVSVVSIQPEGLQFYIPTLVLFFACCYEIIPNTKFWGYLLNRKVWMVASLVVLIYIAVAWVFNSFNQSFPTFGSYNTEGVLLLLFALSLDVTKNKLDDARSWFLAVSAVFFSIGFWEILYQVCSWTSYYHTWFPAKALIFNEITNWRPHPIMCIPFIVLMVYYGLRYKYKFNWYVFVPIGVFAAFWLIWYYIGDYWIIWYCDHNQEPPLWIYHKPIEWVWYLGARGSKAVLAITQILLISGFIKPNPKIKYLWIYAVQLLSIIMIGYLMFRIK